MAAPSAPPFPRATAHTFAGADCETSSRRRSASGSAVLLPSGSFPSTDADGDGEVVQVTPESPGVACDVSDTLEEMSEIVSPTLKPPSDAYALQGSDRTPLLAPRA